jgi:hypothetical protein
MNVQQAIQRLDSLIEEVKILESTKDKQTLIISKYEKLVSLQTNLLIVNLQLKNISVFSSKYIELSNQKECVYEEIRLLKKEIEQLKS